MYKFLDGSQCPCLISSRCIDPEGNSSNILFSKCMDDSIEDLLDDEKEKKEELLSKKNKVVISPHSDYGSENEDFFVSRGDDNNRLPPADMLNSRGNTESTEKMITLVKRLKKDRNNGEKIRNNELNMQKRKSVMINWMKSPIIQETILLLPQD
jgi:hypothetical protein